jgi:hypothetical protein
MEILPSILSQAVYGENGRTALPLSVFMKQSNQGQIGGKKDIKHLGVPMIVALVNVNINKPCNQSGYLLDQIPEYVQDEPIYKLESTKYLGNYEPMPTKYAPVSDEVYDSLFNTVLDEPIVYNSEHSPRKYTRKNKKIKIKH